MLKQILAIAYVVGVLKAFGSGFLIGVARIFIPPIAIFMLFCISTRSTKEKSLSMLKILFYLEKYTC